MSTHTYTITMARRDVAPGQKYTHRATGWTRTAVTGSPVLGDENRDLFWSVGDDGVLLNLPGSTLVDVEVEDRRASPGGRRSPQPREYHRNDRRSRRGRRSYDRVFS